MWKEFKTFILRGNVLDLAIGIVIGTAFTGIVGSAVNDVIMPPLGVVMGSIDFKDLYVILKEGSPASPYANLDAAKAAGAVTLRIGLFINTIVNFLIIAAVLFLVIKAVNKLAARLAPPGPPPPPATKDCGFCRMAVPMLATRCPHCTSELKTV